MRFDSLLTVVFVLFALYFGRSSSNNAHKFMQVGMLGAWALGFVRCAGSTSPLSACWLLGGGAGAAVHATASRHEPHRNLPQDHLGAHVDAALAGARAHFRCALPAQITLLVLRGGSIAYGLIVRAAAPAAAARETCTAY
jgi:hypothetical protein